VQEDNSNVIFYYDSTEVKSPETTILTFSNKKGELLDRKIIHKKCE